MEKDILQSAYVIQAKLHDVKLYITAQPLPFNQPLFCTNNTCDVSIKFFFFAWFRGYMSCGMGCCLFVRKMKILQASIVLYKRSLFIHMDKLKSSLSPNKNFRTFVVRIQTHYPFIICSYVLTARIIILLFV